MTQTASESSKFRVMKSFEEILDARKSLASKVATKEEEAEKEKGKQILETAATYTADSIVKGLADLQLDFGSIVNQLLDNLHQESTKLEELKLAIEIENQHLQELQKIRIVADALHILTQEHQEKLGFIDRNFNEHQENIAKDMTTKRKAWQKEQQEYEVAIAEENQLLIKQRENEAADYQYELEHQRKIETDEYEEMKRNLERELQELNQEKEKKWQERESYLAENQAEFEENRQKVEGFEEELKQAYVKAKDDAIKEASRQAKVKEDLFAKEWEGMKNGYELKIESLEETIQRQTEQINDISTQLQAAMKQAQDLAMRAFASSNNGAQAK
ncbi:MAG: hypothetical protein F6K54_25625 [Okeania sp. SIO3B5]|uniref:hypothetical protein n=1 Tax=Okeania sp. SIO3B5 TaxID=2607811 RepID=UPI001400EF2A|nr:hypothetical protein [Okeania sp. SIO3B5]NEO56158.1 hypothetical protein [Okeania sp. SIO3B5]